MEFQVLEERKTKLIFTLKRETHTFCNALKNELEQVKGVTVATYHVDHPLIGLPKFHLETKNIEPRKALKEALDSLKDKAKQFQKELTRL